MILKAAAMGHWWLAASSQQHTCSCITSHAELFGETSNHPGDSAFLQSKFGTLWLLAFPKLKSPLKGKRFQDRWWDSEKYNGAADGNWENCVRSQGTYFEGDWGIIVLCTQFFLYLVSSLINVPIFHITWLGTFWTDLVYICIIVHMN